MIVAALSMLQTRVGVALATAGVAVIVIAGILIHYEGLAIGPLQYIPGIRYILPEGKIERVRREAVEGLVLKTELDAANAKIAERDRQLAAGRVALDGYADLLKESQARERQIAEADAKDDADYEAELRNAGRSCPLDQSDIDRLRK